MSEGQGRALLLGLLEFIRPLIDTADALTTGKSIPIDTVTSFIIVLTVVRV